MKEISLNELPMYTDWVKKLLSLDEFEIRYKSKREIQREFEDEKWGPLLQDAKGIRDLSLAHVAKDIEELEKALADELNLHIKVHDNRDIGNPSNEVIFEIKKGK